MKRNLKLLVFVLICWSIIYLGCKKDNIDNSPDNNPAGSSEYFRAKIDGVQWTAKTPEGFDSTTFAGYSIVIRDANAPNDPYSSTLFVDITPVDSNLFGFIGGKYITQQESYSLLPFNTLTLQISTYDTVNKFIEGKFSFYANEFFNEQDTIHITNGEFGVNY